MESGRSFVEMLGTLALMGILSVVGILGYTYLIDQHKANEILQAVNLRATLYATQNHNHPLSVLSEFQASENIGGVEIKNTVFEDALNNRFAILTENVPPKVCTQVLNKLNQKTPLRMIASYAENKLGNKINSSEECVENLAFVFNNDLETNDLSICSAQQQRVKGDCCDTDKVCGEICCGGNTPLCNSETHQCEGCISDDDCLNQEDDKTYCNTATYTCEKPYIELEYIESTGTQYIDTGLSLPDGFKSESEVMVKSYSGSGDWLPSRFMGSHHASAPYNRNHHSFISEYTSVVKAECASGGTGFYQSTQQLTQNVFFKYEVDNTTNVPTCKVNGSTLTLTSQGGTSGAGNRSSYSIYLMATNQGGTAYPSTNLRFRYVKIWDKNNILLRHFIPCYRKSDNKTGAYDLENGVFYPNKGSGEFITGPEVE